MSQNTFAWKKYCFGQSGEQFRALSSEALLVLTDFPIGTGNVHFWGVCHKIAVCYQQKARFVPKPFSLKWFMMPLNVSSNNYWKSSSIFSRIKKQKVMQSICWVVYDLTLGTCPITPRTPRSQNVSWGHKTFFPTLGLSLMEWNWENFMAWSVAWNNWNFPALLK